MIEHEWTVGQNYSRRQLLVRGCENMNFTLSGNLVYSEGRRILLFKPVVHKCTYLGMPGEITFITDNKDNMDEEMPLVEAFLRAPSRRQSPSPTSANQP